MLRTCLDDFEVNGPERKHMYLVYRVMREPFWIFERHFIDHRLPLPVAKAYIYFFLVGLDYLHLECKVVEYFWGEGVVPVGTSYKWVI